MKWTKQKRALCVIVLLSVFTFMGTAWSQISLPTAVLDGSVATTTTDLTFNITISRADYVDGVSFATANGPDESIINAEMVISGATRTGPLTFSDASLEVRNPGDSFQYITATLTDIVFEELYPGVYFMNLLLDAQNPSTLNLSNVVLGTDATHPSRYINEIATVLIGNDNLGMQIGFYVTGGDITGVGNGYIFYGVLDGAAGLANNPPTADAGVTFNQAQCLATTCDVTLDGSQSIDPDSSPGTNDDITSFGWFEDLNGNGILGDTPEEQLATGEVVTVSLSLGFHEIFLKVTDSQGETDVDTITVVVDVAELSFIELTKVMVKWNNDEIKIKGKLALPAGVSLLNVNSVGHAIINLSGLGDVVDESVDFTEHGNGEKWKYHASTNLGIHKFKIDWHGEKFKYKINCVEIETHHFGIDTTTIEVEFCDRSIGPVTVDLGGGITVDLDASGNITVTGLAATEYDIDYHGSEAEAELVLPYAIATTDVISITGTVNDTFTVADYYIAAVGKFKIKAYFDSAGIDPTTLDPKTLTLDIALGDEGFSGIILIDNTDWTKITDTKWKYKASH